MNGRWILLAAVMIGTVGAVVATDLDLDPLEDARASTVSHGPAPMQAPLEAGEPSPEKARADGVAEVSATVSSFEEFTMFGCQETFASLEVPKALVDAHVPSGFEPIPSPFSPSVDLRPTAMFVAVTSHCDKIVFDGPQTDAREASDTHRLWYAVAVDPPDEFEDADVDVYFYPFRFVVSEDTSSQILTDWEQHVETGAIELSRQATGAHPLVWDIDVESQEVSFEQGARGAIKPAFHDPLVRLFAHPSDGTVDHAIDMEPQGNTRFTVASQLDIDLDARDSPFPSAIPRQAVDGNLKVTPSGEVALHGDLVSFEG